MIGSVPNIFNTQAPPWQIPELDADFKFLTDYINSREITSQTSLPTPGQQGRFVFNTADYGGTLYYDDGVNWNQITAGLQPYFVNSVEDATDVVIVDSGGAYQTISSVTISVPTARQVSIQVLALARISGAGVPAGSWRLRAGLGPTPPIVSAVKPLHVFQSGYLPFTFMSETVFAWPSPGGAMTIVLEGSPEAGSASIEFGNGTDVRFQRVFTVTAFR
jgi:hypothetical protein